MIFNSLKLWNVLFLSQNWSLNDHLEENKVNWDIFSVSLVEEALFLVGYRFLNSRCLVLTWKCGLETHLEICLKSGSWILTNCVGSMTSRISSSSPRNITCTTTQRVTTHTVHTHVTFKYKEKQRASPLFDCRFSASTSVSLWWPEEEGKTDVSSSNFSWWKCSCSSSFRLSGAPSAACCDVRVAGGGRCGADRCCHPKHWVHTNVLSHYYTILEPSSQNLMSSDAEIFEICLSQDKGSSQCVQEH